MEAKICKWGNSYGLRLPKILLNELNLEENDTVSIDKEDNKIIISKLNKYGEFNLKELAEDYYGMAFNKLENVLCESEVDWGNNEGEEEW